MPDRETENRTDPAAVQRDGDGIQTGPPIQAGAAAQAGPAPADPRRRRRRWLIAGVVGVVVLGAALYWGTRYLVEYFTTLSTDDAYVNSHVTYVAPRVEDNVVEVLVDDGYFVERGTVLVKLDRYPFELVVQQKRAALDLAKAQVEQALAKVRGQEAVARASWYGLIGAREKVRAQVATLRAQVANLRLARANLDYARAEYRRTRALVPTGAATQEELDQRRNALRVAESQVTAAEEAIQETRANLGLPRNTRDAMEVPEGLEENFSAVQVALSNAVTALAQIGLRLQLYKLTPDKLHKQLENMNAEHNIGKTLDELAERAPDVVMARAQVDQARKDLAQAELNLSYTEIRADVSGFVNRRNVNPGDHVLQGQNLMAIRSSEEVWIDANFKETKLHDIVIGQPVNVTVDAYPGRVFKGRVAGLSPATGSASALLPPENATGNFVKIVQRLPVRIELTEPVPRDTPLFAGLSVVPTVLIKERPTGPNAGERIRAVWKAEAPARPARSPDGAPGRGRVQKRGGAGSGGNGPAGRAAGTAASVPGQPRVRGGAGPVLP